MCINMQNVYIIQSGTRTHAPAKKHTFSLSLSYPPPTTTTTTRESVPPPNVKVSRHLSVRGGVATESENKPHLFLLTRKAFSGRRPSRSKETPEKCSLCPNGLRLNVPWKWCWLGFQRDGCQRHALRHTTTRTWARGRSLAYKYSQMWQDY